jgi:NAD(P)-dependent dehydrogenase (short-subunit alcohol dehydrogenase family)
MAAKAKKSPGSKTAKHAKLSRIANKRGAPDKHGASKASKTISARKSAGQVAIHAFTKSLAQNLVDKGIRVNCVAPRYG